MWLCLLIVILWTFKQVFLLLFTSPSLVTLKFTFQTFSWCSPAFYLHSQTLSSRCCEARLKMSTMAWMKSSQVWIATTMERKRKEAKGRRRSQRFCSRVWGEGELKRRLCFALCTRTRVYSYIYTHLHSHTHKYTHTGTHAHVHTQIHTHVYAQSAAAVQLKEASVGWHICQGELGH